MQTNVNIYQVLKGYFDNSKNYFVFDTERKQKVKVNNLEIYGYFMSGFQDERDTGKLSTLLNCNGSTCLLYVVDENDNEIIVKDFAGEEVPELMKKHEIKR